MGVAPEHGGRLSRRVLSDGRLMPELWAELSRQVGPEHLGPLLVQHAGSLCDDDYWRSLAEAWQDCDRQGLRLAEWRRLCDRGPAGSRVSHDAGGAVRAGRAPGPRDRVSRVRAHNRLSGLSWTLDHDLAHWFAHRSESWPGGVITAQSFGGASSPCSRRGTRVRSSRSQSTCTSAAIPGRIRWPRRAEERMRALGWASHRS